MAGRRYAVASDPRPSNFPALDGKLDGRLMAAHGEKGYPATLLCYILTLFGEVWSHSRITLVKA